MAFYFTLFLQSYLLAQLNISTSSTDNFQCDGVSCEYSGPSILINEVQMAPNVEDGSIYENATGRQGEWIELYNPDECKSIDVSCYYLGNAATDAGPAFSGGYIIPQGTIVPPLGFVVIRGRNAPNVPNNRLIQNGGNTYEYTTNQSNSCIGTGGTRLWFPNAGGWFAFYDQNGVPQDAITWGNPSAVDLSTQPCKPTISGCGFTGGLAAYNNIPNGRKTLLQNNAVNPSTRTFQRQPDGAAWITGEGTSSIGQCNSQCTPIQTISCNGTVTVNVQNGKAPFRYQWNDQRAQTTKTANGLCAGTYCVTVTDDNGLMATQCVEVKDFVPNVTLVEDGDVCEDEPAFPLTGGSPPDGVDGATGTYSGSGVSGTTFNPGSANIGANKIQYVYVDSATCTDTATAIINVRALPDTKANADKEKICLGESVILFGTGADIYAWSDGVMDSVAFMPTETKTYTVTGTTIFGCVKLDSIEVKVSNPLKAGTGDSLISCPGEDVKLDDFVTNNDVGGRWEAKENPAANLNPNTGQLTNTDNIVPGIYNFFYIVEPDAPCPNDTAIVTLTVPDKPIIKDVVISCKTDRTGYNVTFTIEEGDSSTYNVSYPGSISPNKPYTYTSNDIPNGTEVKFYVNDGFNCGLDSALTDMDCSCLTFPGTMVKDTVNLCGNETFEALNFFNKDSINDGNDDFMYFLHSGTGFSLVTPLDSNRNGIFNFNPATMNRDQVYYVSTAMADSLQPNGGLDRADVCFLVSRGTPVAWHLIPEIIIANVDTICITNIGYTLAANVLVGKLPVAATISEDPLAGPMVQNNFTLTAPSNNIPFSPQSTTEYEVVTYTDANKCKGVNIPPPVEVVVDRPIEVDISATNNPSCASPSNPGMITLVVDGDESNFTVIVQNNFNAVLDTFRLMNQTQITVPVSHFTPNAATIYTVVDVFADEPNVCAPIITGQAIINPSPTANISNDGTYCQLDNKPINFVFTGIGPWEVDISDSSGNDFTFTTPNNNPNYTGIIGNQLQPGVYTFTITAVTDLTSGCSSAMGTGTVTITVNPSPLLDLFVIDENGNRAKNHAYCLGNGPATLEVDGLPNPNLSYNLTYKVVGTPDLTYPTIQVDQNNRQFQFDTLSPGTYQVFIARVEDNSPAGCAGFGDTISITVHPLPTLVLDVINDTICLGDQAQIRATVGVNPPISFDLLDGNGLDIQTYTPSGSNSFTFNVTPTAAGLHNYIASNLRDGSVPQCTNTTNATAAVYVNQLPTATIAGSGDWCEGTPFQIPVNVTGEDSVEVVFDLGGITTLSQRFGLNGGIISAILPVGTHTINIISVSDKTSVKCVGSGFGPFTVTVQPTPSASISFNPDPVCLNEPVDVIFSATGNAPFEIDYINDLQQTGTVIVANGVTTTIIDTARFGLTYTITEIRDGTNPSDNLNFCSANPNTDFSPTVNALPTVVIGGDMEICEGETANLSFNFTGQDAYSFTLISNRGGQDVFTQVSNPFNFGVSPDSSTIYTINQLTDGNTCAAIDFGAPFTVTVFENPKPIFEADPPESCAPLNTNLLNLTNNVSLANCQLSAGNNSSFTCNTINDQWTFTQPGTYDLTYTLTSTDGCTTAGVLNDFFTAFSLPIADFIWTPSRLTTLNTTLQLVNKSTEADSSYWEIKDQQNFIDTSTSRRNPSIPYNFAVGNNFDVFLYVETINGCMDSIRKTIPVFEETPVYIPNAFTPNGDGVNETFLTVFDYSAAEKFTLEIFDRWGEKIFITDDPTEAWDGIYRFKPVKTDVYIVKVTVKFTHSDAVQVFEGKVTLLR